MKNKIEVKKLAKSRKGYYLRDDVVKMIDDESKRAGCSGARIIEELVLAYNGKGE
jgi:hypothetical protein